jgi:Fe-S-cluster containining protein
MPHHIQRYATKNILQQSIKQYQSREIISHCQVCQRPCCKLTDVVLEFDWKHLRELYRIELGQKAFDRSLRDGSGPEYVRKQMGLYYTHGSPCPAYDEVTRRCRHYHSRLKPDNCTDFPLYLDGETIVADLRCEAMNKDRLLAQLQSALPNLRFRSKPDPKFPMLIYFDNI